MSPPSSNVAAPRPARNLLTAALLAALSVSSARAATLVVNSSGDDVTPGDGMVTLREAIGAANLDAATDLGDVGSGADTIDLSAIAGTILLGGPLPVIASDITILGPGRPVLTIQGSSGNGAADSGIFFVTSSGALQLQDLTLAGGVSQGGAGGSVLRDGAGGGAGGAGGAVFVDAGTFGAANVNFFGNIAHGGAGGATNGPIGSFYSGGGGGFGENAPAMLDPPPYGSRGTRGGDGGPLGGSGGAPGTSGSFGYAGNGEAGGGGGGGGTGIATRGGNGGFLGGGGGANWAHCGAGPAGTGGYGGGGGGGDLCNTDGYVKALGGAGGTFGGKGGDGSGTVAINSGTGGGGGGGGGLGGALFAGIGSTVNLTNCRFSGNQAQRGLGGSGGPNGLAGSNGQGKGGAIFLMSGVVASGTGVSFSDNAADDAALTVGDNADYFGQLNLTQGRQFGFTQPAVRVDARTTSTLHLLLPVVTSDGAPTLIDAGVTYGTADGSAHAGANYLGNGGMIAVPHGTPSGFPFPIDVTLINSGTLHGPITFTVGLSAFMQLLPADYTSVTVTIIANDTLFRSDFDGDGF